MKNKALTSFFMTLGFIIMFITGIILYLTPAGRVANWVNWSLFGLSKTQWGNIHILAGFMMLIAGCFHVYFNWKPLKAYIYSKAREQFNLKKEMVVSIIVTVILVAAAINNLPPFHYVFEFNEYLKEAWVTDKASQAPLGHGELLSLDSFSKRLKIDLEMALPELEKQGIKITSKMDSLEKIARTNNTSPMAIYQIIRKFEPVKEMVSVNEMTAEQIEDALTGTGLGRRDINWLLAEFNLKGDTATRRLKKNGVEAEFDESFHTIADRYNVSPMDIVKVVLVKGHRL